MGVATGVEDLEALEADAIVLGEEVENRKVEGLVVEAPRAEEPSALALEGKEEERRLGLDGFPSEFCPYGHRRPPDQGNGVDARLVTFERELGNPLPDLEMVTVPEGQIVPCHRRDSRQFGNFWQSFASFWLSNAGSPQLRCKRFQRSRL